MNCRVQLVLLFFFALLALGSPLNGQEKTDSDKNDSKDKIVTVVVESQPLLIYESFSGVFESTRMHDLKTDFDTWKELKVESVIEEGAVVSTGQELIKFETKTIDKAVTEAEFAAKNAEFALETALLEMKEVEATFELDLQSAERNWDIAQQDYDYYEKVQLPHQLEDLDFSEKSAGYFLEYSQDELDQLNQMYTEDELTEESEEIVLKRARRAVESAQRSKDRTLRRVNRSRDIDIPRENVNRDEGIKRAQVAFNRSEIMLPIKKRRAAIALAQAEFSYKNKLKRLEDLKADQSKMVLNSPSDGIVYYGKCVRGKWIGGTGAPKRKLEPGSKVAANAVVMTIVDVNQMMIRASLDESNLRLLSARARGKALVEAVANKTVPVAIKSISRIPMENGKFDCQIVVENLPDEAEVMPGMSCKLSFLVAENKQAIVAPKASVFSDDGGVSHYVYVVVEENHVRKPISVGFTSGDIVEVLDGLADGDKIAKSKP